MAKKNRYSPGEHPHSQDNLHPRQPLYEEAKKRKQIMVTDKGWQGFKALAEAKGLSASELAERIGRGEIKLGS